MNEFIKFMKAVFTGGEAEIEFEIEWYHVIGFLVFILALTRFIMVVWK